LRGQSALLTAREMEIFEHIFDGGRQGCTMLALCNAIHAERRKKSPMRSEVGDAMTEEQKRLSAEEW